MNCNECRWFSINPNDHYGVCKRYPENQNKNQTDFCGEFIYKPVEVETVKPIKIEFTEPTVAEVAVVVEPPKRGRKPKNAS